MSETAGETFQRRALDRGKSIPLAMSAAYKWLPVTDGARNLLQKLKGPHIARLVRVKIDESAQELELR